MPRIAVLITSHNRREMTLACLDALVANRLPSAVTLAVILVDDGSMDGTPEAVRQRFPDVEVLPGTGRLYWNGGMRRAFGHALAAGFDAYLWLNDDTFLDEALECARPGVGFLQCIRMKPDCAGSGSVTLRTCRAPKGVGMVV